MSEMTSNKPHTDLNVDRLTHLHDDLLHKIIFLLPTNDAAKTSVLSRRWLRLFLDAPHLKLDSVHYCTVFNDRFVDFVNALFQRRSADAPIQSLHLITLSSSESVLSWIRYALEQQVKELDLTFFHPVKFTLPTPDDHSLVASLRKLSIEICSLPTVGMEWPQSLRFSSLTELCLSSICCADMSTDVIFNSCPQLRKLRMAVCPRLESLRVYQCPFLEEVNLQVLQDLNELFVSSDSLHTFVVLCCFWGGLGTSLELNAPNLKVFRWAGTPLESCKFYDSDSDSVTRCLDFASLRLLNEPWAESRDSMEKLFSRVANADRMVMYSYVRLLDALT